MSKTYHDSHKYWFRAKRYGCGCGLPLSWKGWLSYCSYIGLIEQWKVEIWYKIMKYIGGIVYLTVIFILICISLSLEISRQTYNDNSCNNSDFLYRNVHQRSSLSTLRNEPDFDNEDDTNKFSLFWKSLFRIAFQFEFFSLFYMYIVPFHNLVLLSRSPPCT